MEKKNLKRIIKREGLILLGLILTLWVTILLNGKVGNAIYSYTNIIQLPILFGYPTYLLIRLIILAKAYGIKKILNTATKILKIAFSRESLIKVALILGILFLLISILKSCGIYKTPKEIHTKVILIHTLEDNNH